MSETRVVNVRDLPAGWRVSPEYVYCGRPGRGLDGPYGNPHVVGWCRLCEARHSRGEAVARFDEETRRRYATDETYRKFLEPLRGKALVCFCHPLPCHCDTYASLLERQDTGVDRC